MARSAPRWRRLACCAAGALAALAACAGSPPPAPTAAVAPTAAAAPTAATAPTAAAARQDAPAPTALPAPSAAPAPSPAPAAGPEAATPLIGSWEEAAALVDRRAPRLMEQLGVPGAAVAIVSGGEVVWARGYGLADVAAGRPVSPDTVFQAASISKSVTAWGVMKLVAEGRLDLDAPVGRYLSRWQLPPSRFDHAGVTIRRLLSHTAGLSLHGYPGIPPGQPLPTLEESLGGGHPGAGPVEVVSEPGTTWAYSGGGYTLLQLVVEEVTGEAFAGYMRREVLGPLGMGRSSFVWDEALRADTAVGYGRDGQPQPNYLFIEQGPAGLYSTANDLARFAAAGLPGPGGEPAGRGVLPPELLALMYTPAEGSEEDSYGLGYQMNVFGPGLVGHAGANQGWKTFFGVIPAAGEGLVVLTNSHHGRDLRAALVEELYARARAAAGPEVTLHTERAVVPLGPAGAWDSGLMDPGAMVIHDGVFHMLYNAVADFPAPIAVGYATSADGLTWAREVTAPVLTVADIPWRPAPAQLRATSVLVEDGVWVLYFTATGDTRRLHGQIGRATAPSPRGPWTVDPEPVLAPGPAGAWDAAGICCAKVVRAGGGYRMYYAALGAIGVAESPDGISWRKGEPLQLTNALDDPSVQPLGDGWLMVYKAYDGVRRATSADGLTWEPAPDRRLIEPLPVGDIIYTNLLVHDGKAWLYFEGGGRRTSVYLATWPEG